MSYEDSPFIEEEPGDEPVADVEGEEAVEEYHDHPGDEMVDEYEGHGEMPMGPPPGISTHKEHFFLLFCCIALFIGSCLPWEGQNLDLNAYYGIIPGFILVVAAYGIFAGIVNIFHHTMIVWPALTGMVLGLWGGVRRVIELTGKTGLTKPEDGIFSAPGKKYLNDLLHVYGPGLWITVIFSVALLVFLLTSIGSAAKRDKARKEAEREERAARRRR